MDPRPFGPIEPTCEYEFRKLAIAKWEVCLDLLMKMIQHLVLSMPSKIHIRFLVDSFHSKLREVNRMVQNNDPAAMDGFQFFHERVNRNYSVFAAYGNCKATEVEHDLRALRRVMLEVMRGEDFPFRA
ncbi:hypothetical protein N7466_008857 [Penicillium verhagenii]|uniref:uncharacterized protein n=1 Tax=Penicillium verhagenii TaxID=1562060 RepID=UPI0025450F48|nr:uncharacterized protein N7466_008857 [Penicillium verhagenii]KAJ5924670.1 hypothetical protein N7466_008857 [Penicillium verhagenii]